MQNLIVLMEPSKDAENISWKGGKLLLNRFCIEEDTACEVSGVYFLKESSTKLAKFVRYAHKSEQFQKEIKAKGMEHLIIRK